MNEIYNKLLEIINSHKDEFKSIIDLDNKYGFGLTSDEIINFLEFSINEDYLKKEIKTNIIITNGDVYTTLKIIHDLAFETGKYFLFINNNNIASNYYFVSMANKIYENLELDVEIQLDMNLNYNKYLDKEVTLIGSKNFISEAKNDFSKVNIIEM